MYDILELNEKVLTELRDIAKELKIKRVESLRKQDLIYKILDQQAIMATRIKKAKRKTSRSRTRMTPYIGEGIASAKPKDRALPEKPEFREKQEDKHELVNKTIEKIETEQRKKELELDDIVLSSIDDEETLIPVPVPYTGCGP